jgi:hypothetical protein
MGRSRNLQFSSEGQPDTGRVGNVDDVRAVLETARFMRLRDVSLPAIERRGMQSFCLHRSGFTGSKVQAQFYILRCVFILAARKTPPFRAGM